MRVSIITILDNTNFGTYLQAIATGLVIKDMGHEVQIINYTRPMLTYWGFLADIYRSFGIFSFFKALLYTNRRRIKLRKKDFVFLQRFLKVTKEYYSYEQLKYDPPLADVYVTGSDQVWNSQYNQGIDKSFYLGFVPSNRRKVAYGASIGMDDIPIDEIQLMRELLKQYYQITVREKKAQELLKQLGILSQVVLDPTLLLDKNKWDKIASTCDFHVPEEPYLLVYSVETKTQNSILSYYATQIAKQRGLKVYQVCYEDKMRCIDNVDKFFGYATPDVFLNLMKNAAFVVVSSFHGTAFAINYNKQFFSISANRFNSRIINLLEITGLENRLLTTKQIDVTTLPNIDYEHVNQCLDTYRKDAINILKNMIES